MIKTDEEIWLTQIHNDLNPNKLIDLHTYFWKQGLVQCPICDYSLTWEPVQNTKEASSQ